jgi:uroporphyrinogen III methyltransferase / synthase
VTIPIVSFVGAGPGDAGLLTVGGLSRIQAADVILHDPQISKTILQHARSDAEIIDVGRTAPGGPAHEAISYLIADKAREGRKVVRLKWGDPFVFDRGTEEALWLEEQRVPFEVVPGVPAGIAVPAYAGVAVAGPGANAVTLVRGFEDKDRTLPDVDWEALARLRGTVVCYAGAQQLPQVLQAMLTHGWAADSEALIVYNGTLPGQESLRGTLAELHELTGHAPRRVPGVLIAGPVVALRDHLRWFDARPLFGRRVLVTRPRDQAGELVTALEAAGAETVVAPMIAITAPDDPTPLLRAAARPDTFDWIVFASANGVEAFMTAFFQRHLDIRGLSGPRLCAVGTGTADKLRRYGIAVDLIPGEFRSEAVVAALAAETTLDGCRVLLPRADIGREVLADELRARGALVTEVVAYQTVLDPMTREATPDVYGMLLQNRLDVVTFTSASAVRNFTRIYGTDQAVDLLNNTVVAAIGPVTTEAATQLGVTVAIQPATYTIQALVAAIADHFAGAVNEARPTTSGT